ncbi:MAG: hypothetical protein KAU58_06740 [Candidatus Omnitrophica bacterium]|nr:hypothetical protein [Candidatus Omnitrophota bacterium]
MSKCLLVKLLKNEIQNLNHLVESLEDKSKLCFPSEYDCSACLREVISNLRRIEKDARRIFNYRSSKVIFHALKIGG